MLPGAEIAALKCKSCLGTHWRSHVASLHRGCQRESARASPFVALLPPCRFGMWLIGPRPSSERRLQKRFFCALSSAAAVSPGSSWGQRAGRRAGWRRAVAGCCLCVRLFLSAEFVNSVLALRWAERGRLWRAPIGLASPCVSVRRGGLLLRAPRQGCRE